MKELEVKIAEIEGNSAEEKSKDLHTNEEIVPVSIQKTIGCFLVWPHFLVVHFGSKPIIIVIKQKDLWHKMTQGKVRDLLIKSWILSLENGPR